MNRRRNSLILSGFLAMIVSASSLRSLTMPCHRAVLAATIFILKRNHWARQVIRPILSRAAILWVPFQEVLRNHNKVERNCVGQ